MRIIQAPVIQQITLSRNQPLRPLLPRTLPIMIPPLGRRIIGLQTPILNREHISKDPLLNHGLAKQSAPITSTSTQFLTSSLHAVVLTLEFELAVPALLGLEQLPGSMDGPVAEVAVSGEAERTRCQWVVEKVADECW